jgi:hypothetical protein
MDSPMEMRPMARTTNYTEPTSGASRPISALRINMTPNARNRSLRAELERPAHVYPSLRQ